MQQKRELGQSGVAITPLLLGGNVFGWTAAKKPRTRCSTFVALGGDAIDTADV